MFSKKHIINLVSVILILLIDSTFILIYAPVSALNPVLFSALYLFLFIFIIRSVSIYNFGNHKILNENSLILFSLFLLLITSIWAFDFSGTFNVNKFITARLKLQNMHYYMNSLKISNLSVSEMKLFEIFLRLPGVAGLLLTVLYIIKNSGTFNMMLIRIILLLFTPLIYPLIIIRSEFLFMVVVSVILIDKLEKRGTNKNISIMICAGTCLAGLLLFLNLAAIILLIVFSLYYFRNNIFKAIGFILITLIILLLLINVTGNYLPFRPELFSLKWVLIGFCILAVYLGWSVSNISEVFFASGVLIFLLLTSIIVIDISSFGIAKEDIRIYSLNLLQYFMPVILLLYSMHEYKIDRHLGKIL